MIVLDRRETDIRPCFSPYGIEIASEELEFGDAYWVGNGPDSAPSDGDNSSTLAQKVAARLRGEGTLTIGVERKKIRDLVASMRDRRLGGFQAPGMASTYDIRYLLIEGIWRCGKTGILEEFHGRDWRALSGSKKQPVLWVEVDAFMSSLEEFFGFRIKQTQSERESAAFIVSRYKYWQKPYDKHRSHKQVYAPLPQNGIGKKARFISLEDDIRRTCGEGAVYVWKFAAQMDGLDGRAELAARMFKRPEEMFNATVKDWQRAGLGPKTITRVMEILHGRTD